MSNGPHTTGPASYTSLSLGMTADRLLVMPINGALVDWSHVLSDTAVAETNGVAWLLDQDTSNTVAALFTPSLWTLERAQAWLSEPGRINFAVPNDGSAGIALAAPPKPTRILNADYVKYMLSELRKRVKPDVYEAIRVKARGYAGGKAGRKIEEEAEDEINEVEKEVQEEGQVAESLAPPVAPEIAPQGAIPIIPVAPPAIPPMLSQHLLAVATAPSADKPYLDEATGYVWKPILRAATVFRNDGQAIPITREIIAAVVDSFGKCGIEHVDIPDRHYPEKGGDAPLNNTGFIRALKLTNDGNLLWGAHDFTDLEAKAKVLSGSVANTSVWLEPNFHDLNQQGKVWPWVLWHVALTNKPQMTGLAAFSRQSAAGALALSTNVYMERITMAFDPGKEVHTAEGWGGTVITTVDAPCVSVQGADGVRWFPETSLMEGAPPAPPAPPEMDPAVQEMQQQLSLARLALEKTQQDMQREIALAQTEIRERARETKLSTIIAAMEGRATYEGVQVPNGFRHAPATIAAVKDHLTGAKGGVALSVNLKGDADIDSLVLSIINSLPQSAFIAVEGPRVMTQNQATNGTEATVAAFAELLQKHKVG